MRLREKIFEGGRCLAKERSLGELRDYCAAQVDTLWDEVKRFENPHQYYVDLSPELWKVKTRLLEEHTI